VELEGVHAEHEGLNGLQRSQGAFAAVGFTDAGDAVIGGQDDDGAKRVGRVAAVGAAERGVCHRDRVD